MKKTVLLMALCLITAASAKAQLVNGALETWRDYTVSGTALTAPTGWFGLDSSIAAIAPFFSVAPKKQLNKSTDKHGGTYSALLISHNYGSLAGVVPGVLSNAKVNIDIATMGYSATGGTAVTQRISSASAWVKYIPSATSDSASFGAIAILQGVAGANGSDSVVGAGTVTFGAKSAYTQMTVNIAYTSTATPNRIQIGFLSGILGAGTDSSALYVDDVTITAPNGISQQLFNANVVTCYPNPSIGVLYLSSNETETLNWEALNATGQIIARKEFTKTATVELGNMPAGLYYYRVANKHGEVLQTGKFSLK